MRIGIMGGTFDPIHLGHLFIAEDARVRLSLDVVHFIPNGSPPHKSSLEIIPSHHRYEMVRLATDANPYFVCNDIEMNRIGPAYAIDTLEQFKADFPDSQLFFVTGLDAVTEITSWKRYHDVMELASFVVATRPGFHRSSLLSRLPDVYLSRIEIIESIGLDISSTQVRERIASGLTVRYLVPDEVLDYIDQQGLYGPEIGAQV